MNYFRRSTWRSVAATLGLAYAVFVVSPVVAEAGGEQYYEQESHVHGLASLFIVLEGSQLLVELESPGMNLIGFEHVPRTEVQHQQVEKAEQQLMAGGGMFSFKGGQCQLLKADIKMVGMAAPQEERHESSESDGGHYLNHEDHEDHEDHEGHEVSKASTSEHSDVEAKYLFNCDKPETLLAIDVALFDEFSGLEELDAQWVVRSFQGGKTLSPAQSRIELQ